MSPSSSSSSLPLLILLLTLASLSVIAFSEKNKCEICCSDEFARIKNQRNITMCKALRTLGAQFAWKYQNGTNGSATTFTVDVLFGAKLAETTGWLAWGVNPGKRPEMIGTNAIIGIIPANGHLKAETYEISKETRMGCHLLPSDDLEGVRVVEKSVGHDERSNYYTVYAKLELNSSRYNISRLNHVWQIGYALVIDADPQSHPTTLHNVDSVETIDLTSGSGRSVRQYRSTLRAVHGVLNIVGWGTLLPIGVIVARYTRVYPCPLKKAWFYLHVGSQSAGYLIGAVGWGIGLWLGQASRYYTFQTHRIFAIFIFTFTTIQMLALRLKPKVNDDYRKYWNMYHHFLGYALLVTIIMNIFKGISILKGGKGWRWGYIGILCLMGAITLALEIYTWLKFFQDKRKHEQEKRKSEEIAKGGTAGGGKATQQS